MKKKLTPPHLLFKEYNDKEYTQFDDETGVPTHWIKEEKNKKSPDVGKKIEKEIVEQERKKLIHLQTKHAAVYEKAIKEQNSSVPSQQEEKKTKTVCEEYGAGRVVASGEND